MNIKYRIVQDGNGKIWIQEINREGYWQFLYRFNGLESTDEAHSLVNYLIDREREAKDNYERSKNITVLATYKV